MKKILSFVLVLAMIASMMCVNVAAENYAMVGSHIGGDGTVNDGVGSWTETKNNEWTISAAVDGRTEVRYAVDLEYTVKSISVYSDTEWNVNTLEYVGTTTVTIDGQKTIFADPTISGSIDVANFTFTNRSNADVTVKAVLSDLYKNFAGVVTNNDTQKATDITAGAETIESATVKQGEQGIATTASYTATLTCSDWQSTFATVKTEQNSPLTLAKITFTISATD